ncbi:MAG: aminotransferase class V-fold PLP-dependent enzyme [Desulfuromonadales bacterium]
MPIYLDNAATSFPKPEDVYRATDEAMRTMGGNPGRGGHSLTLDASRLVLEAREAVAEMFGIPDAARVAFMANATEAINTALFGILRPGDRVVTTSMEHNAVTRPLRALEDRGVEVVKVPADETGYVPAGEIRAACTEKTRMVVVNHCSNVTGTLQPIDEIGPWCRRNGILFFVDAAQSAGLFEIDVEDQSIDLLAAPGHKSLLGPQGTGFLYVRDGIQITPLVYGGTGGNSHSELPPDQMPERLESGTLNLPGLAGLAAALDYIKSQELQTIRNHERHLLEQLIAGLGEIPQVTLFGPTDSRRHGGALSFIIEERDPSELGFLLDRDHGICLRVGLHCAPDAHRTIGTFPRGTVRVSPGYFNGRDHIDHFLTAVAALATHPRK